MFKTNQSNNNQQERAVAFLNLSGVDGNGKEFKIRKGIPLVESNLIERSLANAAIAADADGDTFTITLTGTVNVVVDAANQEDLTFS